jgi:ribosomal 30S subunit maturation factor RimM
MKSREIKLLDVVALLTDLPAHGLHIGRVGTVVEQLAPDVWEVEFSDSSGETIALIPMEEQNLLLLHFEVVAA